MWLFTNFGFFSVVQKTGESDLTVRTRFEGDLEQLRKLYLPALGPTIQYGGTDYQFRATASHADVAAALAKITQDIHYDNFKDAVDAKQGVERHDAYYDVWMALDDAAKRSKPGTPPKAAAYGRGRDRL